MLKKNLKYYLNKKGFYRPNVAVDFRGLTEDPLDALERSGINPCLIEAPFDQCRTFGPLGFGCTTDSLNPFVRTLLQLKERRMSGNHYSILKDYYESFQPNNVAELFGLDDIVSDSLSLPPNTYTYPWQGCPKMELQKQRVRRYMKFSVSDFHLNDQHFGPQSEQNITQHLNRLTFLDNHFKSKPYDSRNYLHDEIIAELFVHNGKSVFRIRNGHHRVAALTVLGYDRVEVRIDKDHVYRREDSGSWEGVRKGCFTEEQALAIFDQIFFEEHHSYAKRMKAAAGADLQTGKV